MPLMSFMLEGLVTTLLSLDYMGGTHQEVVMPNKQHQHQQHQLQSAPLTRCRSNSLSSSSSSENSVEVCSSPIYEYHCPPAGMTNYDNNDTVFGKILRGDLPAITLAESNRLLAIEDIKPRAPLHALIITKPFVGSIFDVDQNDLEWMEEMHQMALDLVQTHHPDAFASNDYRLCFHIPPFNSVDHIHLHVLAPVSEMGFYYRNIKYNPNTRWCKTLETVLERLERGETSVPYRRPPSCRPQKEKEGLVTDPKSIGDPKRIQEEDLLVETHNTDKEIEM